jgi:hypothetical protein
MTANSDGLPNRGSEFLLINCKRPTRIAIPSSAARVIARGARRNPVVHELKCHSDRNLRRPNSSEVPRAGGVLWTRSSTRRRNSGGATWSGPHPRTLSSRRRSLSKLAWQDSQRARWVLISANSLASNSSSRYHVIRASVSLHLLIINSFTLLSPPPSVASLRESAAALLLPVPAWT